MTPLQNERHTSMQEVFHQDNYIQKVEKELLQIPYKYDDLKEKLNRVIAGSKNTETASEIDLPPSTGKAPVQASASSVQSNEASKSVVDEDDTLSYFSKLAEDE